VDCVFSGKLRKTVFNGTVKPEDQSVVGRHTNEFRGNDFSRAKLEDVSFRTGIDLERQKLPEGPSYLYLPDAEAAIQAVRREVIAWSDLDLRQEAMATLNALTVELEGGQRQLLLDIHKPADRGDRAVQELLKAFSGLRGL
jgi:hypothetical protein